LGKFLIAVTIPPNVTAQRNRPFRVIAGPVSGSGKDA
jgi:hypothetical protein